MNRDDAEEYTQALGQVSGGQWRQIHLGLRLGVPADLGLTTAEWADRLGGYVRLAIEERRQAVAELTGGEEPLSNVKAAEVLGVTEMTVRRDRASTNVEPEPEPELKPQVSAPTADPASTNVEPAHVRVPQEPSEAVAEFLDSDSDDDLNRTRYRSAISRAMVRAHGLFEFKAEDVAVNADQEFVNALDDYSVDVQNYVQRVHHAMPPGLRAVNGGKS